MRIRGLSADEIARARNALAPFFANFEKRSEGETFADELMEDCRKGIRQCWLAVDDAEIYAVTLTEVLENPMGTVVIGFCTGVKRELWWELMLDEIEAWASHRGARRLRVVARPGWAPVLKERGYRETHRVLEVEIA